MPQPSRSRVAVSGALAAITVLALTACSEAGGSGTTPSPAIPTAAPRVWPGWEPARVDGSLTLASDDFTAGGDLPRSIELDFHGCSGENVRPELHWHGLPVGTKSVVLTFTAEGGGPINRWTVVDVPPDVTELPAGPGDPAAGTVTKNALGGTEMIGPCAAEGETWELWFTAYALDTTLGLPAGAKNADVVAAGAGHVLEAAELSGHFAYEAPTG
jgi:phosphatidylethanolamine-binding protein (PEBP) family uncharacterized protein